MAIPTTTNEYYLPNDRPEGYNNLTRRKAQIKPLKASEVLVKIHAVSLNYRDLGIARGQYRAELADNLVPCSDAAGEVVQVGDDVTQWKVGDRVCANFASDHLAGDTSAAIMGTFLGGQSQGVLTEYRAFKAQSLVAIPDHLSYEEASTLPCAAVTAYNALIGPKPLKAGDFALVQGTGGVSIFALQLAVASGATVIATSSSYEKLKIARKLGAEHLINYKTTPDWDQEALKITGGRGADHIIEVGGPGTLQKSLVSAKYSGWIHTIGFVAGKSDPVDVVRPSIFKALIIRGIQIGSVAQFNDLLALMKANPEVTRPVIDKVFSFEDAVKAYAHLESQAHVGKVVIKVAKE